MDGATWSSETIVSGHPPWLSPASSQGPPAARPPLSPPHFQGQHHSGPCPVEARCHLKADCTVLICLWRAITAERCEGFPVVWALLPQLFFCLQKDLSLLYKGRMRESGCSYMQSNTDSCGLLFKELLQVLTCTFFLWGVPCSHPLHSTFHPAVGGSAEEQLGCPGYLSHMKGKPDNFQTALDLQELTQLRWLT